MYHFIAFPIVTLIGRVIFGLYFAYSGFNHFKNAPMLIGCAASKKIPSPKLAIYGSGALLLLGGLGIAFDIYWQIAVLFIIIFLVPTTLLIHDFWKGRRPRGENGQPRQFHEERRPPRRGAHDPLIETAMTTSDKRFWIAHIRPHHPRHRTPRFPPCGRTVEYDRAVSGPGCGEQRLRRMRMPLRPRRPTRILRDSDRIDHGDPASARGRFLRQRQSCPTAGISSLPTPFPPMARAIRMRTATSSFWTKGVYGFRHRERHDDVFRLCGE